MNLELDQTVNQGHQLQSASGRPAMRVLHVGKFYPPHMGGIETHLEALSGELRKHGIDLRLMVSSEDHHTVDEIVQDVPVLRVGTLLKAFSTPICPGMVSRLRTAREELIHIHLPNPGAVLAYLASRPRGRLVITYHSDTVRQKFLGDLFEPFLHAALRRSSAIIASSPNYLQSSRILNAYRKRCHVIPLGIDTRRFERCDQPEVSHIRQKYGDRVVVAVGRLVYYKGFEYLIRAMVNVRGQLLIVGNGPLHGELQKLASELGVADRVTFFDRVQDIVPYYHAAQVFALPSVARSEAFGIVQIEAMAAGLPVVNTSLDSGVPYVSLHEQTGLTVAPRDPSALATALNRLLDDAGLRKSMGRAGAERARQEFSLELMASRTLRLYQSVLGRDATQS